MSAKMVDVSTKPEVFREARARGCIKLRRETIERIVRGEIDKGDVFTVSKVVAFESAKKTPLLLPFCHPVRIDHVSADIEIDGDKLCIEVTVRARERTGVEMEALTAVAIALLNVWDMVKKYEKDEYGQYPHTEISSIRVLSKVKTISETSAST
ncbi:MAG TPA: cyclic pyranopterin monophosphate synthase MoaC [Ignisphaera aggregans]|uniref:Cyclic pyranopterin monophosphate synthase MoaC n=1 Tax=Ignisphaera aggregans TaxID=334771 RepID=A0A833DTF7_9CREN|nr:cyclic pyranopterin monophosphate synthase MoaC [Ignisphaera aggregans]